MAALLALVTLSPISFPSVPSFFLLSLLIYPVLLYLLVWLPANKMKEGGH